MENKWDTRSVSHARTAHTLGHELTKLTKLTKLSVSHVDTAKCQTFAKQCKCVHAAAQRWHKRAWCTNLTKLTNGSEVAQNIQNIRRALWAEKEKKAL